MDTEQHAERTAQEAGVRAEDIHRWIDGFFDAKGFERFLQAEHSPDYDPYDHRKYRHCMEALDEAYATFEGRYAREQIRQVFECHLRDDYDGYLPSRADFENGSFAEEFHEASTDSAKAEVLSEDELREYFDARHKRLARQASPPPSRGFLIRIVLPAVCVFALFATVVFGFVVPHFHDSILMQKRAMIRELTAVAVSEIRHFAELARSGKLPKEKAQERAIAEVRAMRYGPERKDYFWITDLQPTMLMHPYREDLVGNDLSNYRDTEDPHGKRLFARFAEMVREKGEGYLRYRWQWKDDPSRTVEKLSYVRGVPEWGWIVGTGIYLEDVEADMADLIGRLRVLFGYTALGLVLLLAVLVWQGMRLESRRRQAETGLREARDRYRALVEAATEGTMLRMNGQAVYANRALRRMLGIHEGELPRDNLLSLFDTDRADEETLDGLRQLAAGECPSKPLVLTVRTPAGGSREVVVTASRLFMRGRPGQVITVRPATRSPATTALQLHASALHTAPSPTRLPQADRLVQAIRECPRIGDVVTALGELPPLVLQAAREDRRPSDVRRTLADVVDEAAGRCADFSLQGTGPPPVRFAFLALGSHARREMTLFSDQDNALIFDDVPDGELRTVRRYFLQRCDAICSRLNQAGFPYCEGGLLASNPRWCLSRSEWLATIARCGQDPTAERVRHIQALLDQRCLVGDASLASHLQDNLFAAVREHPGLLAALTADVLEHDTPLGPFGGLHTARDKSAQTLDIKACLNPIEETCRLYACKHAIAAPSTTDRLDALASCEEIDEETCRTMHYSFDCLWHLRLQNQLLARTDAPHRHGDAFDITRLTDLERKNLRNTLGAIDAFHQRLQYALRD